MTSRYGGGTGRALRRHLMATVAITLLVSALVVTAEFYVAHQEADRHAHVTANRVADVADVLAELDFDDEARARQTAHDVLAPLITTKVVDRVKIWRVEGERVRVVYSDEARLVGSVRPFDPRLAKRLDAGEIVVHAVPDDHEHRFEQETAMREANMGFTDRSGSPMRMELYVAADPGESLGRALRVHIPLLGGGLIVLGALLTPLSIRAMRRIGRLAQERQDALAYGLAASEIARNEVAHRLHDGVIQDLAAVSLTMGSLAERTGEPDTATMLRRLAEVLGTDIDDLRRLAHESAPLLGDSLADHLARLPLRADVALAVDEPTDLPTTAVTTLLRRVASELVLNALKHARPSRIDVRIQRTGDVLVLTVADDGVGFDQASRDSGGLGLLLIEHAVTSEGGTFDIEGTPDTGTTATVTITVDHGSDH